MIFREVSLSRRNKKNFTFKFRVQINYQKHVATLDNLPDVVISNPYALHFSGHGVKVLNLLELRLYSEKTKETCSYLKTASDVMCYLVKNNLKTILKQCKTNVKVAVVLSCHSEFICDIFYNAGIKHVICIKEEYDISDSASIVFASTFYKLLLSK